MGVARYVVLVLRAGAGAQSGSGLGALGVLVADDVSYFEERGEGAAEADELGGEDVEVADGLHLGSQSADFTPEIPDERGY